MRETKTKSYVNRVRHKTNKTLQNEALCVVLFLFSAVKWIMKYEITKATMKTK